MIDCDHILAPEGEAEGSPQRIGGTGHLCGLFNSKETMMITFLGNGEILKKLAFQQ